MKEEPLIWGLPTLAGMGADLSFGLGSVLHLSYHSVGTGTVPPGSPHQGSGWSLLPNLDWCGLGPGSPFSHSLTTSF